MLNPKKSLQGLRNAVTCRSEPSVHLLFCDINLKMAERAAKYAPCNVDSIFKIIAVDLKEDRICQVYARLRLTVKDRSILPCHCFQNIDVRN